MPPEPAAREPHIPMQWQRELLGKVPCAKGGGSVLPWKTLIVAKNQGTLVAILHAPSCICRSLPVKLHLQEPGARRLVSNQELHSQQPWTQEAHLLEFLWQLLAPPSRLQCKEHQVSSIQGRQGQHIHHSQVDVDNRTELQESQSPSSQSHPADTRL